MLLTAYTALTCEGVCIPVVTPDIMRFDTFNTCLKPSKVTQLRSINALNPL
jgi:hypothetical protein